MDFSETGFAATVIAFFLGNILCETGDEDETCFQRHTGWYSDHASGTSPDSGRFHSAFAVQSETSVWGISAG